MGGRVGHPQPARFADDKSRPAAAGSGGSGAPPNNQNSQTPSKLEPLRERRSFDSLDIVRRPKEIPVSVLEALRSWRYAKAQPTAAVRRAQSRSAVKLVLTTGACMAAMVLIVIPLLTLEADARGGGGGGGHGGGMAAADMVAVDMVAVDTAQALAGMAAGLAGTTAE